MARINTNAGLQMGLGFNQSLQNNLQRAKEHNLRLKLADFQMKRQADQDATEGLRREVARLRMEELTNRIEEQTNPDSVANRTAAANARAAKAHATIAEHQASQLGVDTTDLLSGEEKIEAITKVFNLGGRKITPEMSSLIRVLFPNDPDIDGIIAMIEKAPADPEGYRRTVSNFAQKQFEDLPHAKKSLISTAFMLSDFFNILFRGRETFDPSSETARQQIGEIAQSVALLRPSVEKHVRNLGVADIQPEGTGFSSIPKDGDIDVDTDGDGRFDKVMTLEEVQKWVRENGIPADELFSRIKPRVKRPETR